MDTDARQENAPPDLLLQLQQPCRLGVWTEWSKPDEQSLVQPGKPDCYLINTVTKPQAFRSSSGTVYKVSMRAVGRWTTCPHLKTFELLRRHTLDRPSKTSCAGQPEPPGHGSACSLRGNHLSAFARAFCSNEGPRPENHILRAPEQVKQVCAHK